MIPVITDPYLICRTLKKIEKCINSQLLEYFENHELLTFFDTIDHTSLLLKLEAYGIQN